MKGSGGRASLARNLLAADQGFLRAKRDLILDRDPLYTKEFRQTLRAAGVKPLLLPARSPNLTPIRSDLSCPSRANASIGSFHWYPSRPVATSTPSAYARASRLRARRAICPSAAATKRPTTMIASGAAAAVALAEGNRCKADHFSALIAAPGASAEARGA